MAPWTSEPARARRAAGQVKGGPKSNGSECARPRAQQCSVVQKPSPFAAVPVPAMPRPGMEVLWRFRERAMRAAYECGCVSVLVGAEKAVEDYRSPRRFANGGGGCEVRKVLECASPL